MREFEKQYKQAAHDLMILENENKKLKKEVETLKEIHMMDIAEVAYLRRQVDFLMESFDGKK